MPVHARFHTLALLGLSALACAAQAQSQYRVFAEAYGQYYNAVQTTSPVFGLGPGGNPNTVYGSILYGYDHAAASAYDQLTPLPSVTAGGSWAGDASQGMTTVTSQAYGMTDWGSNHASASTSGFTPVSRSYDGQFVVGGSSWPMHVESSNASLAVGHSVWEELYQIGGGTGTGQFTGTVHIDGTLAGTLGSGTAILDWSLKTFSNQLVAALSATYDAGADLWSLNIFSNGQWSSSGGNGPLTINQDVIGGYSFTYGKALYLKSELVTSISGNGAADFSNTVQFTGMSLPQNSTVYVMSGANAADYGIAFGGNGSGTICADLACAVGAPVPEPGSYALLLAGLGVVAWIKHRRR
ncbi:MAG: PEP-CTERM sorting domain-containing protein [Comamonadaceae bacterium]|jgi:hypothetical protein|nr:PEP-CTERM sorting domain-containing protein [Comamonadaceae bacterium]